MWTWLAESVRGEAHERARAPCQDACRVVRVEASGGDRLVVAVADGAGSAPASDVGARAAVEHVASNAGGAAGLGTGASTDEDVLRAWFTGASDAVATAAADGGLAVRDVACTLLVAALGPGGSVFGQVGDGAIVVSTRDGSGYAPVFWPDEDGYPDETTFITSPGHEGSLRLRWIPDAIDEVAVFTDGLQRLALDYGRRAAHRPFFAPLFQALQAEPHGALSDPLSAFLSSSAVAARTNDDRTLVLALRLLLQ